MAMRIERSNQRAARRISLSFQRGNRSRHLTLPPFAFYAMAAGVPLLAAWFLCASLYFVFHDEMLASLMRRETQIEYAYEDRIGTLQAALERETSRQLVNQTLLEGAVQDVTRRQAQLENRAALVSALVQRATASLDTAGTATLAESSRAKTSGAPQSANPLLSGVVPKAGALPGQVNAFAPIAPPPRTPTSTGFDLRFERRSDLGSDLPESLPLASSAADLPSRVALLDSAAQDLETDQLRVLARLQEPALREAARIRDALALVGLSAARLASAASSKGARDANEGGTGGPFVPLSLAGVGAAFANRAAMLDTALVAVEHLRRVTAAVPLRQPLSGPLEVSSSFGARIDPFLGRPALHTGVDLKGDYGGAVRATAAGRVTNAERDGGYGNMVEVDHGNGLATRYAHLSSITVALNQHVEAGQVVGLIGATGRATGPHLHYETRIDGEAVDPTRFLRASAMLFPKN